MGDEGKGKITDFLAEQADVIARFQVVITQSYHSVWWRNIQITFSTIRYFYKDKLAVIGNGVVVDHVALLKRIRRF